MIHPARRLAKASLLLTGLGIAMLGLLTPRAAAQYAYPATKTDTVTDTYFGKTYADPYRWLENLNADDVTAWFKAQAELTDSTLAKIPGRDALFREWTALDKLRPARYGDIDVEQGRVFYRKTLGGEKVGKLYYRDSWDGAEKLLFDPTSYKPGVTTTLQAIVPSDDGNHVVIGLSSGGAEWSELRVVEVATGKLLPDKIFPSFGPFSWTGDNRAFLYDAGKVTDIKSKDIELDRKTRLHHLGTDVASDPDIFSDEKNPELGLTPKEFCDAYVDEAYPQYIFGSAQTVQREHKLYYAPIAALGQPKINWRMVCDLPDNIIGVAFAGDFVYGVTHTGAPKNKLVRTRLDHPDWAHAETVVPEAADTISALSKSKDFLFITYTNGITGRVVKYALATGQTSEVPLPRSGSVTVECPDWQSNRCVLTLLTWVLPTTLYDYDGQTNQTVKSVFNSDVVYPGFDALVSEEVEVRAADGALIPLSIIHKKGIPLDGSCSCILEGYGAYSYIYEPYFSVLRSPALHNVVFAIAHVRGGGEKGEEWYRGGFKQTKPNTWKDFIACAEYLVAKGYTSPAKLAGTGTSAGGILISRAVTERPDLFAAAVCNVGCANSMRLEFTPNGPVNIPEFGTVKDESDCAALYEMDGVAHVKAGVKYPALLGVAGWNDRRVPAWQPGKFVAAVQAASSSGRPVMMKINYDDGHFTEDRSVTFRNFSGQDAFMLWQTGNPDYQPAN